MVQLPAPIEADGNAVGLLEFSQSTNAPVAEVKLVPVVGLEISMQYDNPVDVETCLIRDPIIHFPKGALAGAVITIELPVSGAMVTELLAV